MLNENKIIEIAKNYLRINQYPIKEKNVYVKFPFDRNDPEAIKYFKDNNIATVSFLSDYPYDPSDPHQQLVPSSFIVYVNYITGEVRMPRHMA